MIALGIDPGSRRIGYGVVEKKGSSLILREAGLLPIVSSNDSEALKEAKIEIEKILATYKPDAVAIEKIFLVRNQKTAIAVAQFRGVLLLAALEKNCTVYEFSPNEMKLAVTGYGNADKKAVAKMVRATLHEPNLRVIDDVSDALGLAILATSTYRLH